MSQRDWDFSWREGRWEVVQVDRAIEKPDPAKPIDVSPWFEGPVWSYMGTIAVFFHTPDTKSA